MTLLNGESIITAYEKMLPIAINKQEPMFSTPKLEHKLFCENGPAYTMCLYECPLPYPPGNTRMHLRVKKY